VPEAHHRSVPRFSADTRDDDHMVAIAFLLKTP
jgi:hypothetical protein